MFPAKNTSGSPSLFKSPHAYTRPVVDVFKFENVESIRLSNQVVEGNAGMPDRQPFKTGLFLKGIATIQKKKQK